MTQANTHPVDEVDDIARGVLEVLLLPMEKRMKLPAGYFMALADEESDWVFIAKLGLLIEASLTEYLVAELGRRETYEHVSAIDQSKRLKLAKLLGVLTNEDRALLQMISEVRNEFVHRLENLTKPLSTYIETLKPQRKTQIAAILLSDDVRKAIKDKGGDVHELLPEKFRELLLTQAAVPLVTISTRQHRKERERERAAWDKVNRIKANFAFNLPTNPDLVIGPSPDGKPGSGLEVSKVKPSEDG